MDNRTVQTLGVILDDQLPIRLQMVDTPLDHLELFHSPWPELLVETGEVLREGHRTSGEIDENVSIPDRAGNRVQRIVSLTEAAHFFHVRRAGERAIKFVRPGMVLALYASGKPAVVVFAQERTAMPADIVKSANAALLVTHDDHAGIGDVANKIVAGAGNLVRAAGAEPHIEMDCLHLALKPVWIGVVALRKRSGFGDSEFGARVGIRGGHLVTLNELNLTRAALSIFLSPHSCRSLRSGPRRDAFPSRTDTGC